MLRSHPHRAAHRALALATLLIALPAADAHAKGWWPGGGDDKPAAETPALKDDVDSPGISIGWPKIQMPKITFQMPQITWKSPFGGDKPAAAVATENPVSGALDKVAAASQRAADGVRGAWGSAVSKLSFAPSDTPRPAQVASNDKPGFWARLFSQPEPEGSQTVSEFIAQDRVGTTRR